MLTTPLYYTICYNSERRSGHGIGIVAENHYKSSTRTGGSESIQLTDTISHQIDLFLDFIIEENRVQNLMRFSDKQELLCKHVKDIYLPFFLQAIELKGMAADIGSGAGFPGLILKILFSELKITLFESEKKKARFLSSVVKRLSLDHCEIIHDRVESFGRPENFEYVFMRAVSSLAVCLEYSAPLLKVHGKAYFFKGPKYIEEIKGAKQAQSTLHWSDPCVFPYSFEHRGELYHHFLIEYKKMEKTPISFPRNPGMAAKQPLVAR